MTGRQAVKTELARDLTLFQVTMMGIGMMIGAGVFLGVGNAIREVGPGGVVLTFALNGVIGLFTAMAYAELSSAIPRAGGAYNFARIGFGRGTSFVAGWMEWFASSVAGSMYALTLAIYTLRYLEQLGLLGWAGDHMQLATKAAAVIAALFFLYINYRGASTTGKIGAFFTLGQTAFLALIGLVGILVVTREPSRLHNFEPFLPFGWSRLLVTMGFTYVAFEGFEVIAQAGDETIDPKRNLPKAMLYSVYIATITYVVVAFATVVAVKAGSPGVAGPPWRWIGQFREQGFGEAVSRLMPMGNLLLTLAVIFAATSALNATTYSAARVSFALGRDRLLPPVLASISGKRKTPFVALALSGGITIAVAAFLPTLDVASSASMMFLLLFFLVNVCVIKIRRDMGDELKYGFLTPFFPFIPLAAILCQAVLAGWLVHMSLIAWIAAPAWILAGVGLYQFYGKSRAVPTEYEILVLEEEKAPEFRQHRVMVAVANPENAIALANSAYKLCGAKEACVELLHVVPIPDQVPLADAAEYMLEGRESIVEAMLYLEGRFPVGTSVRYCRNVARGIVSAVREKGVDTLIMGWHGRPRARLFDLGSTVDPIVERSPSNVVILKGCGGTRTFKRVLVPVAGGPNGAFALEVASVFADKEGEVVAFTVGTQTRQFNVGEFVKKHQHRLQLPGGRVHAKTAISSSAVKAILQEAEDYDLVVLGCTHKPRLHQMATGSIPIRVARGCQKPLIMAKAAGGIRLWSRRWL